MSVTTQRHAPIVAAWLELTTKCQLSCPFTCYIEAGPHGNHGRMSVSDWRRVIAGLADMGLPQVRFSGGEASIYPHFIDLVGYTLGLGMEVEVLTNLARRVPHRIWAALSQPGVSLAVSYYSDIAEEHDVITGVPGSHALTRAALAEVAIRGIPVRINIIQVFPGQRIHEAIADLATIGITAGLRDVDVVRDVGNAAGGQPNTGTDQLCGRCASGRLAISPDGEVWPCVFARELSVGNVLETQVADVVAGERFAAVVAGLEAAFTARPVHRGCAPDVCGPDFGCSPAGCRP